MSLQIVSSIGSEVHWSENQIVLSMVSRETQWCCAFSFSWSPFVWFYSALTQSFFCSVPNQLPRNFIIKQVKFSARHLAGWSPCFISSRLWRSHRSNPWEALWVLEWLAMLPLCHRTRRRLVPQQQQPSILPTTQNSWSLCFCRASETEDSPVVKDLLLSVEHSKPH